jgi:hypothetical protein
MKIVEDDPSHEVGESPSSGPASVDAVDEKFKTILDIPFVTVVRINGQYIAEVILSGVPDMDQELIQIALSKGREHGVREWFRKPGKRRKRETIYFMPDSEL